MREALHMWGQEPYRNVLCFLPNFGVNLSLL